MPATAPLTDVNFDAFHKLRVSLLVAGDVYWEVVRGGTLGGTPSYTSAGANSAVEYDVAGTTVTGGEVVASGFAVGGGGSAKGEQSLRFADLGLVPYPLTLDVAGANPTTFSLVVTAISGTVATSGALSWTEVR
jgi:hypothetical protein